MAALRAYWHGSLNPWVSYAYGLTGVALLLAPRAVRWGGSWLRSRAHERLVLARAAAATTSVA